MNLPTTKGLNMGDYGKVMETLEKFIYEYGNFRDCKSIAFSFKDENIGKIALDRLQKMFILIPEEEVKKRFPKLYGSLKESKTDVKDKNNYL